MLGVETPKVRPGSTHIYHLFVIRCEERDGLKGHLQKRGVSTGIHYPVPPHLQPAYSQLGYKRGAFPVTERLVGEILSLPMFPSIRTDEIDYVCESIREFYGSKG